MTSCPCKKLAECDQLKVMLCALANVDVGAQSTGMMPSCCYISHYVVNCRLVKSHTTSLLHCAMYSEQWQSRLSTYDIWVFSIVSRQVSRMLHCLFGWDVKRSWVPINNCSDVNPFNASCSKLLLLPYWSNPPFSIFDIRVLCCSGLSARVPTCQKVENGGLDQYGKV